MLVQTAVHFPRNAFSPRDACRAGDVWRLCQDVAVTGSTRAGWPPARLREVGAAFVVREMTVVHHRESQLGEPLSARTWVGDFRRGLFTTRHIRIDGEKGPLISASQEWVHVRVEGATLRPARASDEILSSFPTMNLGEPAVLPESTPVDGREHVFAFRTWYTWMDPLAHANHPAYVDWCDEAVSVAMAGEGLDPVALQPVAEHVRWRAGVEAPAEVTVRSRVTGTTPAGDVVFSHQITTPTGEAATAISVRRLTTGAPDLLKLA